MIEGVKRRYRVCQKRNFIIWSYEDGPIKAEETNPLLKTYTHRCEPPVREAWQSPPLCHCEPAKGGRGNLPPSVIASPPKAGVAISPPLSLRGLSEGEPVAISFFCQKEGDCFVASLLAMTVGQCHCEPPVREAWQSHS